GLIQSRLKADMKIFEFGSGSSTLLDSRYVQSLVTVEHDNAWYQKILVELPKNVRYIYEALSLDGDYCRRAASSGEQFHIIIVDGRDRVNCCTQSIAALRDDGILILDDSEREKYASALKFYLEKGFKRLDFWGIAPGVFVN